jgi:hypothetical protein
MSEIKNVLPTYAFDYLNTSHKIFHVSTGEGLTAHEHDFSHISYCVQGKIAVRKENLYLEMTKDSEPVILRELEWHSIEALEPRTVFVNIFPRNEVY